VLSAAIRGLGSRYRQAGGSLSLERLYALVALMSEKEASAGRLAEAAGLKPNSVTSMIEHLERAGIVRRRRDPDDRRVSWISLTDRGRAEVEANKAEWNQRFEEAFADISDEDLQTASIVLERLALVFSSIAQPDEAAPDLRAAEG